MVNLAEQQSPTSEDSDLKNVGKFLTGFFASIALSSILFTGWVWPPLFHNADVVSWLVLVFGSAELIISIVLTVRSQRFRAVGIGMLASLPISALLSAVYCLNTFGG